MGKSPTTDSRLKIKTGLKGIYIMEVFTTVITAGGLILRFLDACSAYSDEAKSLKTRFDWDIRVLQVLSDYFAQRGAVKANQQLAPEDAALLEQTAIYLDGFVGKVQKTLWKIERKGWLHDSIRHAAWIARRSDLKEMEKEMFEWTRRFDVRLLGLPKELRNIIPAASAGDEARLPAVVRSNNRLKEFLYLASNAKQTRVRDMLLEDSVELASLVTRRGDVSLQPLQYGTEQIIFASRRVPPGRMPGTPNFHSMAYEMGELAAALNCLDPAADIRLLKVEFYFYHADSNQFLFAQKPPYPTMSMMTLEAMISGDPFPEVDSPLDDRLKLAHKIAEAVFFLHTAGFLHKNITSSSVVALRRSTLPHGEVMPDFDDTYLMGFDLIRGSEALTTKEGAIKENKEVRSVWDFDVFQHPERLQGKSSPRYIRTYDIYSLGVVLLEVGFWEPLREIARDITHDDPSSWANELSETVPLLGARTGERYQDLVAWCLNLKGDHIVTDAEFLQEVLDPLEEIVNALSHEPRLDARK
ncbi:hypothetical protein V499_08768 [Pseudogymnoascus sp. VKM F-103]|nr:hypothetical protein V499_08768 [Pseudogymnoascus sp. VKM F-103]